MRIEKRDLYIAGSISAGWSWGASLVFTLTVINDRGMIPFFIWGFCNAFSLAFFSYIIFKYPKIFEVIKNPFIKTFNVLVRIFSIWIQMSVIQEMGILAGLPERYALILSFVTGSLFVLFMYRYGLNGSIFTDQFQWYGAYVSLIILIILGLFNGNTVTHDIGTTGDVGWGIYAGILLLFGPLVDLQNWQRAKLVYKENLKKAYPYAFILFFIYMLSIFFASFFVMSEVSNIVLFVIAFLMATSTLDSDAVALHEVKGEKIGLSIGLFTVLTWQFTKIIGFFDLWQIIASLRMYVAIITVGVAIYLTKKYKKGKSIGA